MLLTVILGLRMGSFRQAPASVQSDLSFVVVGNRKPADGFIGKIALSLTKPKGNPMPPRLLVLDTPVQKFKVVLREEDLGLLAQKVKTQLFREIGNQGQGAYGTIDTSRLDLDAIFDVGLQGGAGWDMSLLRSRRTAPKLFVGIKSEMVFQTDKQTVRLPNGEVPPGTGEKMRQALNPTSTKEEEESASQVRVERWGNPSEVRFDFNTEPANAEVRAEWVAIASKLYLDTFRKYQKDARDAEKNAIDSLKANGTWPEIEHLKNVNPRKIFGSSGQLASQLSRANRGLFKSAEDATNFANSCTFGGLSESIQFQFLLGGSQNPSSVGFLIVNVPLPP